MQAKINFSKPTRIEIELERVLKETRLWIKRFSTIPKRKQERGVWITNNVITLTLIGPWGFIFAVLVYRGLNF